MCNGFTKIETNCKWFLDKEVQFAIISVPTYFNYSQRQAIRDAGTISGLNVLRIIDEPTLAAIAYGFDKEIKTSRNVLIFDLGGGNFSLSLLAIEDGEFEVKAISGNIYLGGEDFDNKLIKYCAGEFRKRTGIYIESNPKALRRLRSSCEKAKRTLSASTQATIDIDSLLGGEDLNIEITRSKFEDLCMDLFKNCLPPIENVLKNAKMRKRDINDVVLVGGSTRIPRI